MPHITLVFPFAQYKNFDAAAQVLRQALHDFPFFDVHLGDMSHFQHGPKSSTLWLNPSQSGDPSTPHPELLHLYKVLAAALPEYNIKPADFKPHMTLGQFGAAPDLQRNRERLLQQWEPIDFRVKELYLITRTGANTPFEVRSIIELAGSDHNPNFEATPEPINNNSKIYVGGLAPGVSDRDITNLFSAAGVEVLSVTIVKNDRKSVGFGFVEVSPEQEEQAVSLSGQDLHGRSLIISKAAH